MTTTVSDPATFYTADHDAYRESVREFIKREVAPHHDRWEEERLVDRAAWQAAGAAGIIGLAIPEKYNGAGEHDYRYRMIVVVEHRLHRRRRATGSVASPSIAVGAIASCQAALDWTAAYVFERQAFGKRTGDFQNTRFELATMETEIDVTRAYVEQCVLKLNAGILTAVEASKAKWWATELQQRITTR